MKIAHINAGNEYGGGLAHIISLLKELKKDDVDLIVFEEGPVAKAARKENIPVYVFEQNNRFDIKVLYRLRHFIKEQGYTILHTHGPRANTLIALLNPFIQVYWVMTVHSHPLLDFKDRGIKGKLFETVHRLTFKKADGIITVSNEIKGVLQSFGVSSDRIKVIHNGIKFSESVEPRSERHSKVFTLITVGRLNKIKGYSTLMDVLKTVGFQEWQWIICGDGEEMESLQKLGRDYDLSRHLNFKGWLPSTEIKKEFHQADIFVLPSLSEGFPMILLEAADEKVPAIATDVGDVKEVIKDASMGWLVPPKNNEKIKDALLQAYSLWEKKKLSEKGKNLHDWAIRFSIEQQAKEVKKFYMEIIVKNRK
ncbi:glycosyltransferase family 4 protein [Alkalibacterium sp. f15]|uniref:glycosyltransferase family 4 protein n=1 Tax=Alkalibacterium sp. f15 TaxID=3414029 RepID=UPI003BF82FD4